MSSLVGTWTLLSMSSRDEVTGDETKVWGDAPLGFLTYTEDGRMSAVLAAARRAISTDSGGEAENAERRERESDVEKNRMEESPEEAARTFAEYIAEERS